MSAPPPPPPPPSYDKPPPYSPYYDPNNPQQQFPGQPQRVPFAQATMPPSYGSPAAGFMGQQQQQPLYPGYGSTIIVQQPPPEVVYVGGCPVCQQGLLEESFTVCGTLMAICFFPIGILCCLAMREQRCSHCGTSFD